MRFEVNMSIALNFLYIFNYCYKIFIYIIRKIRFYNICFKTKK